MSDLPKYLFTGSYRRRPNEILAHASDISEREKFLIDTRDKRLLREEERRRIASAIKIQSAYRSYSSRKLTKNHLRHIFDDRVSRIKRVDQTALIELLKLIRRFFHASHDDRRLLWICQPLLEFHHAKVEFSKEFSQRLRPFFGCCLNYLDYIAGDKNVNFALPLRVVELYGFNCEQDVMSLMEWRFFSVLRKLFECRIILPDSDYLEVNSKMPTPVAEGLFEAILKPLDLGFQRDTRLKIMRHFCWSFLCQGSTPHVTCCIVPALSLASQKGRFDFELLLDSILSPDWQRQLMRINLHNLNVLDGRIKVSDFFAFSLLLLANGTHLECASPMLKMKLLVSLSATLPTFLPILSTIEVSEDDDDKMEIDPDLKMVPGSPIYLMTKSLVLLQNPKIVDALVSVTLEKNSSGDVSLLAFLCHLATLLRRNLAFDSPLLYCLSFESRFICHLWMLVCDCTGPTIFGQPRPLLDSLQRGMSMNQGERDRIVPLLSVFCALFRNTLLAVNDDEFYHNDSVRPISSLVPFSNEMLQSICEKLRNVALGLIDLAFPDSKIDTGFQPTSSVAVKPHTEQNEWNSLFAIVVKLLQQLHERDCRLQFCKEGFWSDHKRRVVVNRQVFRSDRRGRRRPELFSNVRWMTREDIEEEGMPSSPTDLRNCTILREIPFVVPFLERVVILQQLVDNDKAEVGRNDAWGQFGGNTIGIRIRRNYLYEDAFERLSRNYEKNIKFQIRVQMVNWHGLDEAGIDGGGLFREFLNQLLKEAFDPSRGFFKVTPHDHLLYPNPAAPALFEDWFSHYVFLGRMLGKLLYENQMAEIRFASFFLAKILNRDGVSESVDLHHLASLDPVLYKNLLSVKYFEGDVSSLDLDFSILVEKLGCYETVDLKSGGRNIRVDNTNKLEYVHAVADFYLNRQIQPLVAAFRDGMSDVIDLDWLCMFDHREMQVLLSGADADVDVKDMRQHTRYSQVMDGNETIEQFWRVVGNLTPSEKRKLLRFITGCSRPPLMGFKDLYPPLAIQLTHETNRLPTAATCMNLLKLPQFKDEGTLVEKLKYAIEADSGFELS